jgi:hypothetical protein
VSSFLALSHIYEVPFRNRPILLYVCSSVRIKELKNGLMIFKNFDVDHRMSAKLVPTFADRGCRIVSATDSHGR